MLDEQDNIIGVNDEQLEFNTLKDIEQQTSSDIQQLRKYERTAVKASVILQPGNSSELLKFKMRGVVGDISEGGCGAIFPIPIGAGDIYRLEIELEDETHPVIFARCRRCAVIREDAYSAGFQFFNPIKLKSKQEKVEAADLL